MIETHHITPAVTSGSPAALVVSLHPMALDDRPFVRATWRESAKSSPKFDRLPWPVYKATVGKLIDALIERSDVSLLGAYRGDGKIVGWLAWTPGRSVSTVHFGYTRHELDGEKLRRRGVFAELLAAASLGKRVAYTFIGPKRQRGATMDVALVEWAREQGVTAVHTPIEEFLR